MSQCIQDWQELLNSVSHLFSTQILTDAQFIAFWHCKKVSWKAILMKIQLNHGVFSNNNRSQELLQFQLPTGLICFSSLEVVTHFILTIILKIGAVDVQNYTTRIQYLQKKANSNFQLWVLKLDKDFLSEFSETWIGRSLGGDSGVCKQGSQVSLILHYIQW